MTEVQLSPPVECVRCGHKWIPRIKDVRICPKCKSPYWDTALKQINKRKEGRT